jgi:DNA uptake protein ComE-like DNA-binding protein
MKIRHMFAAALAACAIVSLSSLPLQGQVGKSLTVVDANLAPEADLLKMPHMTQDLVSKLVAQRKTAFFNSIVELNAFLLKNGLTATQAADFYRHAFIHVNLNTGTPEEIILIPGAGKRMVREFDEYRPWKSFAQFDKEIGKYVKDDEVQRLKQYVFIPVNLNTATDEDIFSIPGAGKRMVREFKEYRPWKAKAQFEKEIGKYVNTAEVARLWRFVVIE